MEFKKANKSSLQIKTKNSLKIMLEIQDGVFSVKTADSDDNVTSLDKPGEYGVGGAHFVMLEEGVETFIGKPTVVSVSDSTYLNVLVLGEKFDLSKKAIDKVPDPNIVLAPYTNDPKLISIIKKLGPSFVVLVKEFYNSKEDEKVKASLNSDFQIASEDESKVKIEMTDISTEDDIATQIYIIQ